MRPRSMIALAPALFALVLATGPLVAQEVSRTPKSTFAHAFEAYYFQSTDNGWPDYLAALGQQGYAVVRHRNVEYDDDAEGCTISNLISSAGNAGVLGLLHVHGGTGGASFEVYDDERDRDDAFDAYLAAGWNPGDVEEIVKRDWWSGWWYIHAIRLQSVGFANRMKPLTDPLDTIIWAGGICNSYYFMENCGGRVQVGNNDLPNFWMRNLAALFEHLSGFQGDSDRSVGEALAAGSYDTCVASLGDTNTTLAPTVLSHSPTGSMICDGGPVAGSIAVDTESEVTIPATDIIEVSSGAVLDSAAWTGPGTRISFEIAGAEPGETIEVTVDAGDLRSQANGTDLDGDGVRPNGDSFSWTFQCLADVDGDGVGEPGDNCPQASNADQADIDADAFGDVCDNCPLEYNAGQEYREAGPLPYALLPTDDGQTLFWAPLPLEDTPVEQYPLDLSIVIGDLDQVGSYGFHTLLDLTGTTSFSDPAIPASNEGFYYLARYPGGCAHGGSWQSIDGTEAGRDTHLP